MRERYSHWYEYDSLFAAPARPIMMPSVRDLEDLVLQDLSKAQTESERIEILDSYSLANQRKYRNEIYRAVMDISQRLLVKLLGPTIEVNLPHPHPPWHNPASRVVDPIKETGQ